MKKEELVDDEFLKQFKTGDELNGFFKGTPKAWYREDARGRAGWSFGL